VLDISLALLQHANLRSSMSKADGLDARLGEFTNQGQSDITQPDHANQAERSSILACSVSAGDFFISLVTPVARQV
jgi:hypothetical protein